MSRYISADRPLVLNTSLGNDVLLPIKVSGSEAMSCPYRFKLDMLAEAALDFNQLVGHEATLSIAMPGSAPRRIHGILRRVKEGRRVAGPAGPSTFLRYQAELVAPLWRLSRRVQSRVFRHDGRLQTSVPDVLAEVLHDEWRLRVTFRLAGQYAARDHLVQYRESDLAFVSRLMEEEGIFYYFLQHDEGCEMIVTDSPNGCRPAATSVEFEEVDGGRREGPRVREWEKSQSIRAIRHTLRDYSFQKPHSWLEGQQARLMPDKVSIGRVEHLLNRGHEIDGNEMLEVYDYPGGYAHRFDEVGAGGEARVSDLESLSTDKDRTVRLRMQEEAAKCLKVEGAGNVPEFAPGHFLRLEKHPRGEGTYLLTRVDHQATQPIVPNSDAKASYSNAFTCLPEGLPYRPRRKTPRPRIGGTQTAVVCGPAGAKTFVDRFGRIKIQFHWDRAGKRDASSSCWVRVAQTWAGYRIGAFFWPRVGDEVVVSFEEGDPDRPLVIGSVYNAQNMPPLELPEHVLTAGFKSGTLGGDPLKDFNGLLFHDEPGQETVHLHGQKRTLTSDEKEKEVRVGRFQRTIIGGPFVALPGSGSGGGVVPVENEKGFGAFDTNAWSNDLTFAYGHSLLDTNGLSVFSHIGGKVIATFNPMGLVDLFGPASKTAATTGSMWKTLTAPAAALHDVFGGFCSYTVGANTLINYGPTLMAGHGWTVQNFAPLFGPGKSASADFIRLTVLAISAAQVTLALGPFLKLGYTWTFVVEGLGGALMTALVYCEKADALLQLAESEKDEAKVRRDNLTQLQSMHAPPSTLRSFANVLSAEVQNLKETLAAVGDQAAAVHTVQEGLQLEGPYRLGARRVSLTARTIDPIGEDNVGGGSLHLRANGYAGRGGVMSVQATGNALIAAARDPDDGTMRSQIVMQPPDPADAMAGAQATPGIRISSIDGVRLIGMNGEVPGAALSTLPSVDVRERQVRLFSGNATWNEGPRVLLDSAVGAAGTLTLAVGGAAGPQIVLSEHGIELVASADLSIKIGGRAPGDRDKIEIRRGGRRLTLAAAEITVT